MCLGVPGQIVRIEGRKATVDFWGIRKDVSLELLTDSVQAGDFVINHAGFAVRRVPTCDVPDTLALYEVILSEAGEDPIACDVVRELEEVEELAGV